MTTDPTEKNPPLDRYRRLFEGMLNGFALHEVLFDDAGRPADYRFLEVNPAFERITGLQREQVLGRTVLEVLPGTDEEWLETYGRVAVTGESTRFERYHPDLDQHFVVAAFRPAPGQFAVTFADVTERKRTEERLQRQTELLKSILRHIPHRVFWKDRNLIYRGCNENFARDAGVEGPEEIVGKTDDDLAWKPEQTAFFRRCDRQVIDTATPMVDIEEQQFHADGREATILTSKVPLYGTDGEVLGVLGIYSDITQRVTLEAQLRQSQRLESVGRLAGGIAHDFNNLLTVILGQGELLLMDELPEDTGFRNGVEDIVAAGERARALTQQLLAFSRRQVLQPRVLDLNEVVSGSEQILRRLIGEDIALFTRCDPALYRVKADPGQLEQVVLNLAVNARDAMPKGGTLSIETANVELDSEYCTEHAELEPGPYARLAVSDTGGGIPPDALPHLFEPFFTTKDRAKGTGLGLSTVYGIVKQSGGHIWVYSEPGKGSTFKIYLPRTVEALDQKSIEVGGKIPRGEGETVLLVEDDPGARATLRRFLDGLGYRVLEAESPAVALRRSGEHTGPIDLLLTDVIMPGMGGPELAAQLLGARPSLRVLYVSGYTDEAIGRHGVLEPGVAFLQKPLSRRDLAGKVREVLEG